MKSRIIWIGLVLCLLCVQLGYGNTIRQARRITGMSEFSGHLKPEEIWNPLCDEARQYVGPLESRRSERFRVGDDIPRKITNEKDLWRTLNGMHKELQEKREISLGSGVSEEDVKEWLRRSNNPYMMWGYLTREEQTLYLRVSYWSDARVLAAFFNPLLEPLLDIEENQVLKGCCNWISANIRKNMPNLLKIRKVQDAVIDNTEYNLAYTTTAEVVIKGKGRCASYTTTTMLLLHMLGIDCRYVYGDVSIAPDPHAWNLVDVNGEWYHMDTTWNDSLPPYQYFLLTDEEMGIDHIWPSHQFCMDVKYPKSPRLSSVHFFTRADYVNRTASQNGPRYPVDTADSSQDSLWKVVTKGFGHEVGIVQDQNENPIKKLLPVIPNPVQNEKSPEIKEDDAEEPEKQGNAYLVRNVDELNEALKKCASELKGPEIHIRLGDNVTLSGFRGMLKKSDIHSYIRAYSYTSNRNHPDAPRAKITLKVEYWPHVRLISASQNKEAMKELSGKELHALELCQEIANAYGAKWKLRRQKIDDVYLHMLNNVIWKPGRSSVVSAMDDMESGSLGMAEALQVVYSLMKIPVKMVHGRTDKELQAWNVVQHLGDRWYHSVVAQDAEARIAHRHVTKWNRCGSERMRKTHVWYEAEVSEVAPAGRDASKAGGSQGDKDSKKRGLSPRKK